MTIGQFLAGQALHLVALAALLAAGALFSGAETALFSLSRGELFQFARDRHRLRQLAASLMRRPDEVLTTVLLGTNVTHIFYFVSATLLIVKAKETITSGRWLWTWVLTAGTMLAVILFSEILPKTICFLARRRFAPPAAAVLAPLGRALRPVRGFLMGWLITPLTRLLAPAGDARGGLTVDEMAALLTLSQKRGLIGDNEGELLQEVLELTDLCAGDVMVPRVDVVAYDLAGSRDDLVELMREKRVNKVPVYTTDLDHVAGVIHAKRLLSEPLAPLSELVAPVKFVPELARLEAVLVQFRARGSHLAVVVDEYGGVAGVLTLKDILEEVVGDIVDARQRRRPPTVRQVGPAEWLVDGDLAIHEWSDAFPTDLHAPRFNTVGGFVISLLGQLPELGQVARYRNVTFTVEAVQRNRIATLRVQLEEQAP